MSNPSPSALGRARDPRAHWVALLLVLGALLGLLVMSGVTTGQVGEGDDSTSPPPGSAGLPKAVAEGGPVIDPAAPAAGARVPAGRLVLTFDDGPSEWTGRVLDVLEAQHVPATFFVVGAQVAQRPGLVRRMYDEGHEVGVHTFTHVNMAIAPRWRDRVELDQTQLAIAAATGHTTNLLRPPYSSTAEALTSADWRALRAAGNYRVVLTDLDTRDWARPGAARIAAAGMPKGHQGAVVMLHDGGGNRSQTVAALDRLIVDLKARGYTFDTVTGAIGARSGWQPATSRQRVEGELVVGAVRWADGAVSVLGVVLWVLALLAAARTLLLLVFARHHARRARSAEAPLDESHEWPPVSVVVPAYNEEVGVAAAVRSLVASDYPELEVIVVDDGSSDGTARVVEDLDAPGVRLIRQRNAGKPAALNTGIDAARHDVLVLVDADTVFEPGSLKALVRPFADPEVGAVSGNTKVGNRRGLLGRWQHIEYVIGFNLDRRMFDTLRCMPTVPGAIGAFRRATLRAVGGVSDDTLAEDTDLTMATCRAGWRVVYAPEARAWTEAPSTLSQLWRQRYRWCYGTMQAMWKHRRAALDSGPSGQLGRRGLPYLLAFQVLLPLLAPIIDVLAVYSLVFNPSLQVVSVWLAFLGLQLLSGVYAFVLDRERLSPLWSLPLQQLVYRQLMYLVVVQSVVSALYGLRLRWHTLRRTGALDAAPVSALPQPR